MISIHNKSVLYILEPSRKGGKKRDHCISLVRSLRDMIINVSISYGSLLISDRDLRQMQIIECMPFKRIS